jgi:hypothetical protein
VEPRKEEEEEEEEGRLFGTSFCGGSKEMFIH